MIQPSGHGAYVLYMLHIICMYSMNLDVYSIMQSQKVKKKKKKKKRNRKRIRIRAKREKKRKKKKKKKKLRLYAIPDIEYTTVLYKLINLLCDSAVQEQIDMFDWLII